jgi:hypothetical protein
MVDKPRRRFRIRPWLRAFHRDIGYFLVGLTFVYALSGLAVNHIGQWNPNFHEIEKHHQLSNPAALPKDDDGLSKLVLRELSVGEKPSEVYRASDTQLDIVLERRTLHVDTTKGTVFEEGEEPRFFLRLANWLHLNRGKKAWTYFADGYAVMLLFLATSGLFMIPGKKGLVGRGAIITFAGILVPVLYVVLSGGP